MLEYKGYVTFIILEREINIISDEMVYGRNTVAEIDGNLYYLGNKSPNISTAIFAWQKYSNRELTADERYQVMMDNAIIPLQWILKRL